MLFKFRVQEDFTSPFKKEDLPATKALVVIDDTLFRMVMIK